MRLGALVGLGVMVAGGAWAACAPQSVEFRSAKGSTARFTVEIADDAAERAQGLMNRPEMAKSQGMIFVYAEPGHHRFWMKNTLIPLDLLFIDPLGRIKVIHPMAKPLDTSEIDGGPGVQYVVEVNGGLASALGLAPGDVMRWQGLGKGAAWPCE